MSQGTAAAPASREVRSPGWNLAQRCALSKERSCPNHVGLCKDTATLKDTRSSCNILYGQTTGYLHPQTLILPSTCHPLSVGAPICCVHLVLGKDSVISAFMAGGVIPASPRHLSSTRHLTSSAWPGRSTASFFVLASQTFSVLSLLPLTSKRLSADQAI